MFPGNVTMVVHPQVSHKPECVSCTGEMEEDEHYLTNEVSFPLPFASIFGLKHRRPFLIGLQCMASKSTEMAIQIAPIAVCTHPPIRPLVLDQDGKEPSLGHVWQGWAD